MERPTRIAHWLGGTALVCGVALMVMAAPAMADKTTKTTVSSKKADAKAAETKPVADATPATPAATPAAQPTPEQMMEMMMKSAAPGPEHAALNPLAGSWKTVVKSWMDPTKDPITNEGTCERSWVMGGRYLVANYKGSFMGAPFEGMEVLGYDNAKKQYVSSWVDNFGTGIMASSGPAMDPATKSFTLSGPMMDPSGAESSVRQVTAIVDGNTYTMTMFGKQGGQEMKMMEITYTRAK